MNKSIGALMSFKTEAPEPAQTPNDRIGESMEPAAAIATRTSGSPV
jgi:hypothetical protein